MSTNISQKTMLNVYYVNFPKTYELSMFINNASVKELKRENSTSNEIETQEKYGISASLSEAFSLELSNLEARKETKINNTSETLEIKMTKSLHLSKIIPYAYKINEISELNSLSEGALVYLNEINLELKNEEELRSVKLITNGILKGFKYENIELENFVNSVFKDYTYLITGKIKNEKIIFKIPLQFDTEFENLYNIDDILIGKVDIIGIYKGKIEEKNVKNTFLNFDTLSNNQTPNIPDSDAITNDYNHNISSENNKVLYFDLIAIVQKINYQYKEKTMVEEKKNIWKKLKKIIFRRKNE